MIDITSGIAASKEKELGQILDALELSDAKELLQSKYPTVAFDFDFVEKMDDIAEMIELINDTLADPTVEYIESVFVGGIHFRLTQAEIERRRAEDAEMD